LLEKVHSNVKAGHDKFVLYELGKAHIKGLDDTEKLPMELQRLSLVVAAKSVNQAAGAAYFTAKKYLTNLLDKSSISEVQYKPVKDVDLPKAWQISAQLFEPSRTAAIYSQEKLLGLIGEPGHRTALKLKLPVFCAGLEIDISALMQLAKSGAYYQPLNRFPGITQDICLRTNIEVSYGQLEAFVRKDLNAASEQHGYVTMLEPIDIFQRPNDKKHKQTTWRITLWHPDRTLTTIESSALLDKIANNAAKQLEAERV
jgi:phenylalanyl-tRNA synthetase beta subunit